ncbi:hypothetical protein TSUD_22550 [Trifolium subterraneum]|uniref:Pre-mRNA-splicing factor Syf1/CRNKL1-like C-terminal HAT-repeats domain-containing protein n=1 Tax=Trifolium subterraneum TaxID=3900 RepID=A0A2Z6N0V8_TRISU|nr:hypothetical protein TSUD_22550 [Trifolium subterraneum]
MELQEDEIRPAIQLIAHRTELDDYRLRKRKEFEDLIRRQVGWNLTVWIKYTRWEESQKHLNRVRYLWERALEHVQYKDCMVWLKYAEFEMRHRQITRARNVWDLAVTLLPKVNQLWFKYIQMEKMLGNVARARQIFKRWMEWMPDQRAWLSYIKFESEYNEIRRVREIFECFVSCHPTVGAWLRYAEFEMKNGQITKTRNIYERAVDTLVDDKEVEQLFVSFAEFESMCNETERAKCIYKFIFDRQGSLEEGDFYGLSLLGLC